MLLAAILVVIIGLMYMLFLFSWQWILQLNKNKMFKWIRNTRLNSFMDAYHAPYHFKYHYWTGLLLFVRVLLYLIASILQNKFADARVNLSFHNHFDNRNLYSKGILKDKQSLCELAS